MLVVLFRKESLIMLQPFKSTACIQTSRWLKSVRYLKH